MQIPERKQKEREKGERMRLLQERKTSIHIFKKRCSAEGMMLKLKLQYFGHLMQRADSLEKTLMLEGLGAGGEGDDRRWDGWMASLTQWTWVWVNSRSWWWTGRPGMLRFMGLQRVGHDWATELNWTEANLGNYSWIHWSETTEKSKTEEIFKTRKGGKLASKEATEAQKEKNEHFNVLKQRKFHLEFYIQQNTFQ